MKILVNKLRLAQGLTSKMSAKCKYRVFSVLFLLAIFLQGCYQDYTVEERTPVSGKLIASSERQDVAFNFDNVSTFPDVKLRLRDFSDPNNRRIEVTEYLRLPILNVPGAHFEMWAVSETNQVSFGKFRQAGGELVTFMGGVTGATKCGSVSGTKLCTFTPTDPTAPVFNDLTRIEISIESPGDADTIQSGSIILSGNIINQNGGIVDPLTFPISFSQNAITATASLTLIAEDAKEGLVALNLTNFPFLDNLFAYQLWSADSINGFVSCGSFNVQNGVIVNPVTNQPKGSNDFACGVDLTTRTQMVISLEPIYTGNSAGIFDYKPYMADYQPFTNANLAKPAINGVRASIAGADRDRVLTDVEGNFSLATTALGSTYVVLRSIDFEPAFVGIDVKRDVAISGLSLQMRAKVPGEALFHFFARDYNGEVNAVQADKVGFFGAAAPMNDDGENGDLIKGDGIWTVRVTGKGAGPLRYTYTINGAVTIVDPHHENLDDSDTSTGIYTVK